MMLTAALLVLAGCGAADEQASPVAAEPSRPAAEFERTVWQLVGVRAAGVVVPTRPNLDVTLVVQPGGRFLVRSCNNVFGDLVLGESTAMVDGGSGTNRVCPGAAGEVDEMLRSAMFGEVGWKLEDRSLSVTNIDHDVRLDFRVKDPSQPPTSAVRVATVGGLAQGCRIMVGVAEAGERLYALARTRPGGPWRLVRGGPAAPGDAPLLAPELLDRTTGRSCTAGFAPPQAVRVGYQIGGDGPVAELRLHHVAGIGSPVYAGVLESHDSAEPGRLRAYDAQGRVLALWSLS